MHTIHAIRRINDDLAIAGQITLDQIKQLALEGYQSVLNLRSPDEADFSATEQRDVEASGLAYINIPVKVETLDSEGTIWVLNQIEAIAKPTLVHCSNATIAAAMVLIHIAIHQGSTLEQAFQQAAQLGLFRPGSSSSP